MRIFLTFFLLLATNFTFSQDDYRTWIKGKVLYKNVNVTSANVINNTSQQATTTNADGEFEIEVNNVINEQGKLRDGINFVNLYRLISNSLKNDSEENQTSYKYNPSDLLRELYDDVFFTKNLLIPNDKINEFLLYCDDNFPDRILLKKDNEFELIEFLVKQSKKFVKSIAKN